MKYRSFPSHHFATGQHAKAARVMAGLDQSALASLAGLHVNSLKRVEGMGEVRGSEHACQRIADALRVKGIATGVSPHAFIQVIR